MNRYGRLLMRQWARADPVAFCAIPNPHAFFTAEGVRLAREIKALAGELAGPERVGESNIERLARVLPARVVAESNLVAQALPPGAGAGPGQASRRP